MKSILFILTVFALAILYNNATKETKKYKRLYFAALRNDLKATECLLIDTLDTYPNDSLVYRLHGIHSLLNER